MSKTKKNLTYLKRMIEEELKTVIKERMSGSPTKDFSNVGDRLEDFRPVGSSVDSFAEQNGYKFIATSRGSNVTGGSKVVWTWRKDEDEINQRHFIKLEAESLNLDRIQEQANPDDPIQSGRPLPPNAPSPANQTDDIYRRISTNLKRIQKLENKGESVNRILESTLESLNIIKADLEARDAGRQ